MVKEILKIGFMAGGYPINGKPKEKTEKMHPKMKMYWIAFFAILALVAIIGYFALAAQTPVKTATDASTDGDAKATPVPGAKEAVMAGVATGAAANSAADTKTGRIEVPADAWILEVKGFDPTGPEVNKKIFPIGKTPVNIWIKSRSTILKDVKITSKQISGITVIETPTSEGTQSAIWLYFYKDSNLIRGLSVYTSPKASSGNSGNKFKMEFPKDVWTANEVAIIAEPRG